jgi:hypothetical protein
MAQSEQPLVGAALVAAFHKLNEAERTSSDISDGDDCSKKVREPLPNMMSEQLMKWQLGMRRLRPSSFLEEVTASIMEELDMNQGDA